MSSDWLPRGGTVIYYCYLGASFMRTRARTERPAKKVTQPKRRAKQNRQDEHKPAVREGQFSVEHGNVFKKRTADEAAVPKNEPWLKEYGSCISKCKPETAKEHQE